MDECTIPDSSTFPFFLLYFSSNPRYLNNRERSVRRSGWTRDRRDIRRGRFVNSFRRCHSCVARSSFTTIFVHEQFDSQREPSTTLSFLVRIGTNIPHGHWTFSRLTVPESITARRFTFSPAITSPPKILLIFSPRVRGSIVYHCSNDFFSKCSNLSLSHLISRRIASSDEIVDLLENLEFFGSKDLIY